MEVKAVMREKTRLLNEEKWVDVSYSHMMYRMRYFPMTDKHGDLEIRFKNQRHYVYFDVPKTVAKRLTEVVSPGKYFIKNIRNEYGYEAI
jgi:hypothetical protein